MLRRGGIVIVVVTASLSMAGQSASEFEVASVKLHAARGGQVKLATSGSRLNAEAKTLSGLIAYAYDVRSYQVPYTPALEPFGDLFYDIAAKAAGDAPRSAAEFRQMTQSLLADRFKLRVHRDKREIPVYALVQSRKGARLRESASDVKAGVSLHGERAQL